MATSCAQTPADETAQPAARPEPPARLLLTGADATQPPLGTDGPRSPYAPGQLLNEILNLQPITFGVNSPELTGSGRAELDRVAQFLIGLPGLLIDIRGHTDSDGADDTNLELSRERAEAVQTYLVEHGVSGENLRARGYGDAEPSAPNTTSEGKARNRRIDLVIRSVGAGTGDHGQS